MSFQMGVTDAGVRPGLRAAWSPWVFLLAGFGAMYAPIYWSAANGMWQTEDQGHGAIVLAVVVWLFWRMRDSIAQIGSQPAPRVGILLFGCGLILFLLGRAFSFSILEFASQPFVVAGALLLMRGWGAVRIAWFAIIYFVFMIPLPTPLVDSMTGPLKQSVSHVVETLLYALGYPISRTGVILSIGQYQLQVADACSGLHSMFSLSALGTLFMYLMNRRSWWHNGAMLLAILPIAYCANVVRVIALVLITYYLGDEAGQGFLHGLAGMVLMLAALAIFFALDWLLMRAGRIARSDAAQAVS